MLKPALFTALVLAAASPALAAEPHSPGHLTLARIAGVAPGQFSNADLQRLIAAQRAGDAALVDHILNTSFAPGEVISITHVPELPAGEIYADGSEGALLQRGFSATN
ncbi:hypothetical protein PSA7680_00227 [Pseudoruegeria aquimaris]|uniref:Uncharacterized protein n=1 Tax=Pseudoruegeria aquimaris TaxID=393663 RepID=A0A1Y5RAI4_9RHOB|nr:hypothetical protein [Pseudoruegeria aquimaris]SLN12948.1 hypothetical protein PSA7680_00227 [Pseudoruegeria aquimaris]